MRIEHDTPNVPSRFTLAYSENGAHMTAERYMRGEKFRCIRYGTNIEPSACIEAAQPLCRECATGQRIRYKAGAASSLRWTPEDINIPTTQPGDSMSSDFICAGCNLKGLKHKAKNLCERCYGMAKRAKSKATPLKKTRIATDQEVAELFGGFSTPSHNDDFIIDLSGLVHDGMVDCEAMSQMMQDFAKLARAEARTPEAQLYRLMCRAAYETGCGSDCKCN